MTTLIWEYDLEIEKANPVCLVHVLHPTTYTDPDELEIRWTGELA
jgi:hypothetical protein